MLFIFLNSPFNERAKRWSIQRWYKEHFINNRTLKGKTSQIALDKEQGEISGRSIKQISPQFLDRRFTAPDKKILTGYRFSSVVHVTLYHGVLYGLRDIREHLERSISLCLCDFVVNFVLSSQQPNEIPPRRHEEHKGRTKKPSPLADTN